MQHSKTTKTSSAFINVNSSSRQNFMGMPANHPAIKTRQIMRTHQMAGSSRLDSTAPTSDDITSALTNNKNGGNEKKAVPHLSAAIVKGDTSGGNGASQTAHNSDVFVGALEKNNSRRYNASLRATKDCALLEAGVLTAFHQ